MLENKVGNEKCNVLIKYKWIVPNEVLIHLWCGPRHVYAEVHVSAEGSRMLGVYLVILFFFINSSNPKMYF